MEKPRVIFLTPTFNNAETLHRCFEYLKNLYPQPFKHIILENNSVDATLKVINGWKESRGDIEVIRLWFRSDAVKVLGPYGVIGTVRQILLDRARRLDPDYAIFIDDDVFIGNVDFILRVTSWNKDLVGGPYLRKFPEGMFLASKWLNLDRNRRVMPYRLKSRVNGFEEVFMTSAGALCISRRLLQDRRVNFMPILSSEDTSEDFGYCIRARKAGYKVWIDGTLKMGHYIGNTGKKAWSVNEDGSYKPFVYPEDKKA